MQTTLPAVQAYCSRVRRYNCVSDRFIRREKRIANRRHRHYLNKITKTFILKPWLFDDEAFNAPSTSSWDLW
jgi:hypothetical protein